MTKVNLICNTIYGEACYHEQFGKLILNKGNKLDFTHHREA